MLSWILENSHFCTYVTINNVTMYCKTVMLIHVILIYQCIACTGAMHACTVIKSSFYAW